MKTERKTKERVYVCHTFYNIYVTLLKEFHQPIDQQGKADLVISTISTDFTGVKERIEATGVFANVYLLDEKKEGFFPQLAKYRKTYHNVVKHLVNRILFTKKFPKLLAPYMTVDFGQYKEVNVYCDSDPIGYYLNANHIYYHAIEDGLDCLKYLDGAHYDNRGNFKLKALLSKWNLIFIQNGYGKYCLDMEVNDFSCLRRLGPNYKEVPRRPMEKGLTSEQKKMMLQAFIPDADALMERLTEKAKEDCVLFLTQPHPQEEEARLGVCAEVIRDYCQGCHVVIKPHPRDLIDYQAHFENCTVIKGKFPVEVLNFMEGIHFKKAISIITTAIDTIEFAEEKILIGEEIWDKYEDPAKHNWRTV